MQIQLKENRHIEQQLLVLYLVQLVVSQLKQQPIEHVLGKFVQCFRTCQEEIQGQL